jgi:DNA-binding NarL/FixJ family response regulator
MTTPKENNTKRRVFLVDDHPLIRERLTQLIERESDLTVCGEAESAPKALRALDTVRPDLVVVDISLKDSSGLELIKDIKAIHPEIPVLVLSMHDESLYAERVLRAGAKGYITKQEATTKVLAAIRRILSGEVYMSEDMVARLLNRCAQGRSFGATPVESLADRELEVFQMIGRGKGTRQIAEDLHIGIKTVESYRARIKEKLNLDSANALVQYAIQWVNELEKS